MEGTGVDKAMRDGVDAATEVRALGRVVEAVGGLDAAAARRVLEWAWSRFVAAEAPDRPAARPLPPAEPADLADLYVAARPATDAERVLVVAYWHQAHAGKETLDAQTINTDLKNLGQGVGNVTRACSALIGEKPQLMLQVKKAGSTRQARKQYRLTTAGLLRVRDKLAGGSREPG